MGDEGHWKARRLAAQGLICPAEDEADYIRLFRSLQPVSPIANAYPGSPPRLEHRIVAAQDAAFADALRARHGLIKGRYFGGRVGYVWAEDLPLYVAACRRPLNTINDRQAAVLRAFEVSGPLSPRQLREQTGMPHRALMAAVKRLEEAFLVCEDQTDDAWDRPLHLLEREWPEAHAFQIDRAEARSQVLKTWAATQIEVSVGTAASATGWARRDLATLLKGLCEEGTLQIVDVAGEGRYRVPPPTGDAVPVPSQIRVMHRDDPLVRPLLPELKRRYEEREILRYLLIDDDVAGALCGHWRIGPHDVDEVLIDDETVADKRRDEILAVVAASYPPPERRIHHINGEPVSPGVSRRSAATRVHGGSESGAQRATGD